jgi:signal transduction histidine kinase
LEAVDEALRYVQIAALAGLALVCFPLWRARRDQAALWALATFGLLAAVSVWGLVSDALYGDEPPEWIEKTVLALVVLFPYLLYRFAASFRRPSRRVELAALALTAIVVAWALLLPGLPAEGEPRPDFFLVFVVVVLVQWTALLLWVAGRLWRAGAGQPTVVRYRMRTLAGGALALGAAIVIAGLGSDGEPGWLGIVDHLLVLAAALLFFVGLAPPSALRKIWRGPEEELLRRSVDDLLTATNPDDVTSRVLPVMAALVGADAIALAGPDGAVLGSHGLADGEVGEQGPAGASGSAVVELPLHSGSVRAWTTPYAPFFGSEEFDLLGSLGTFALLAVERTRLFAHEREARLALEEADELKSQFIALASHELRTPAAVIHGLAQTLHMRGDELSASQVERLRETLHAQTDRMRRLVDQLLDLSRLEAGGIKIDPEPFWVRSRIEELVLTVASERTGEVTIDVPPDLEAVADPNAFDRIVSNLIVNALRYGSPPVSIVAEQRDRHFRLTVEDRGAGVAPEFVPQLFERFTRSDAPGRESPGREGAGLGLAIAKSYAHAHGGDLLYEQATPRGARFRLVLPRPARPSRL